MVCLFHIRPETGWPAVFFGDSGRTKRIIFASIVISAALILAGCSAEMGERMEAMGAGFQGKLPEYYASKNYNASKPQLPATGWQHHLKIDPITDFKREYAQVIDEDETPYGQLIITQIDIGCGPEGLYISVNTTEETEQAIFRIDSNQPVESKRFVNFDGIHFGGPEGEQAKNLVDEILVGEKLVVRRQSLSAATQTTHTFDISKNKRALSEAIQDCH